MRFLEIGGHGTDVGKNVTYSFFLVTRLLRTVPSLTQFSFLAYPLFYFFPVQVLPSNTIYFFLLRLPI